MERSRETIEIRIARVEFPSLGLGNFIERLRITAERRLRNIRRLIGAIVENSSRTEEYLTSLLVAFLLQE